MEEEAAGIRKFVTRTRVVERGPCSNRASARRHGDDAKAAFDCLFTLWNQKGRERERSLRQPETMSELAAWIKAGSYQWSAIEIVLERRFSIQQNNNVLANALNVCILHALDANKKGMLGDERRRNLSSC